MGRLEAMAAMTFRICPGLYRCLRGRAGTGVDRLPPPFEPEPGLRAPSRLFYTEHLASAASSWKSWLLHPFLSDRALHERLSTALGLAEEAFARARMRHAAGAAVVRAEIETLETLRRAVESLAVRS